jgi:hypothetical protein
VGGQRNPGFWRGGAAEFQVFRERTLRFPDQVSLMCVTDTDDLKASGDFRPGRNPWQLIDNMLSGQKPYNAAVELTQIQIDR